MLGTARGPRPIAGVPVVLHRVGSDRAGPLDSSVTDQRGRYAFRYRPTGTAEAIYFVSASYQGIAYFTSPLRAAVARGDDALITVFDTTSAGVPIHVVGRHFVLGVPNARGRREVVEVFELGNDSNVTVVSGGAGKPVWAAQLPAGAESPRLNPTGEIAPNAVRFERGRVELYAPMSPGARQLSFAYDLPRDALPLSLPIEAPSDVLEVLVEEPRAVVAGVRLSEVAPVTTAGRTFRRLLAQSVPAASVLRIDVPVAISDVRARYVAALATTCGVAMLVALVLAFGRRRVATTGAPTAAVPRVVPESQQLIGAIASLDARFEQKAAATAEERATYEADRAALKRRLVVALADERGPA